MNRLKNNKLAIVTSGGGMACSYTSGVLKGLIKKYNLKKPDIVIGSSGSAGIISYYVAGQYDNMIRGWYELSSQKRKFVNPLRFWKIMDIDYLVDEIIQKKYPLNVDRIQNSKTKLMISATDYLKGRVKYFSNFHKYDIYKVIKASKSLPIAYNRKIKINKDLYCDSPISSSLSENLKKAVELGAKKIIAIHNTHPVTNIIFYGYKAWLSFQNKNFRNNHPRPLRYLKNVDFKAAVGPKVEIVSLKPELESSQQFISANRNQIKSTIKAGYQNAVRNKELEKLFS
ncbi:MAG: hypothetical protein GF347_01375 [Candidatus Moranbacteria bacterium]|nr:hypothetical protein [Candidatus Moranbacteria bacterium]